MRFEIYAFCIFLIAYMSIRQRVHLPEDEDEEDEKCKECGNVVHGSQHDNQLIAQCRHEAYQLEDSQKSECAQNRETTGSTLR